MARTHIPGSDVAGNVGGVGIDRAVTGCRINVAEFQCCGRVAVKRAFVVVRTRE